MNPLKLSVLGLLVLAMTIGMVGAKDEPVEKADDYVGKYIADGEAAGGKSYKAMVEITREKDTYNVSWVISPNESYTGVGLLEGDTLCVGWSSAQGSGLILYKPDGEKLGGRWTAPGAGGKVFKETLTPLK